MISVTVECRQRYRERGETCERDGAQRENVQEESAGIRSDEAKHLGLKPGYKNSRIWQSL